MKLHRIAIDTRKYLIGSALRNFVVQASGKLFSLSVKEKVRIGDVLLVKVIDPNDWLAAPLSNYIERFYYQSKKVMIRNERVKQGALVVVTAGNRYSTRAFTGGVENPVSGERNEEIVVGGTVHNLGHFNICGKINYNYGEEEPSTLQVLGVMMHRKGTKINIRDYPRFSYSYENTSPECQRIVVTGDDTESGKTTICATIASLYREKGIPFVYQKISGGPRIRDIVSVLFPEARFHGIGDSIPLPLSLRAMDFVDIGYISSHSVPSFEEYSHESISGLTDLCKKYLPKVVIVEVAGNYSQKPNQKILQYAKLVDPGNRYVVAASHGIESATGIVHDLVRKGVPLERIGVSGLLTSARNADLFESIASQEIGCLWLTTNPELKEEGNAKRQWENFIFGD